MRIDPHQLEQALAPLLAVRGIELVAVEWAYGRGRGLLRIFIDHPGGDPRKPNPATGVSLDDITNATRDVSSTLDALDIIESSYTLEVGSPGLERPVQKRADYDRFAGLRAHIDTRDRENARQRFDGTLRGTSDLPDGDFAVRIDVGAQTYDLPAGRIVRTRLHEIEFEQPASASAQSRRQQRLAARAHARAVNAAHRASVQAGGGSSSPDDHRNDPSVSASSAQTASGAER